MRGEQGKLKEIAALKKKFNFRFLVDDAHGFGTLGESGAGAGVEQGIQDEIDVYFATFAKAMASTGAFIAAEKEIIDYLKYNMRSQMFAKSFANAIGKRKFEAFGNAAKPARVKTKAVGECPCLTDGFKRQRL